MPYSIQVFNTEAGSAVVIDQAGGSGSTINPATFDRDEKLQPVRRLVRSYVPQPWGDDPALSIRTVSDDAPPFTATQVKTYPVYRLSGITLVTLTDWTDPEAQVTLRAYGSFGHARRMLEVTMRRGIPGDIRPEGTLEPLRNVNHRHNAMAVTYFRRAGEHLHQYAWATHMSAQQRRR